MLFKIMIALAAYYLGKANLDINEFLSVLAALMRLDNDE